MKRMMFSLLVFAFAIIASPMIYADVGPPTQIECQYDQPDSYTFEDAAYLFTMQREMTNWKTEGRTAIEECSLTKFPIFAESFRFNKNRQYTTTYDLQSWPDPLYGFTRAVPQKQINKHGIAGREVGYRPKAAIQG